MVALGYRSGDQRPRLGVAVVNAPFLSPY